MTPIESALLWTGVGACAVVALRGLGILSRRRIADLLSLGNLTCGVACMVLCAGGVPVFADLESDTCNVDPDEIERLIDADTGAVMVTHLHGLACDMGRISAICRDRGVPLVEDAAQAIGATQNGRASGAIWCWTCWWCRVWSLKVRRWRRNSPD